MKINHSFSRRKHTKSEIDTPTCRIASWKLIIPIEVAFANYYGPKLITQQQKPAIPETYQHLYMRARPFSTSLQNASR